MNQEKHSRESGIALERVLDLQAVEKLRVRSFSHRMSMQDSKLYILKGATTCRGISV
jgi:hypothetical protein